MSRQQPQPLADCFPEIERRIRAREAVSLFLDFDGTLTPLVGDPAEARLDAAVQRAIDRLSRKRNLNVTVISGRSLHDLHARIGLPYVIYAGNHGFEIKGPGLRFMQPIAGALRPELQDLCSRLAVSLSSIPGAKVENKVLTASVHYRQADPADVAQIEEVILASVKQNAARFRVSLGHQVFEILPVAGWNKGAAVNWIHDQLGGPTPITIYLGDDSTDEAAFRMLTGSITVKVGPLDPTSARYHSPGPAQVREFLLWLESIAFARAKAATR
ncbi:MAG: trehalose-phosphatase [Acidobacteriales bacterium]|nr:trehalose-phosphatase [Terriglobales bacterium]